MQRKGKEKGRDVQRQRVKGGMGRESKGIGHGGGKAPSPTILAMPLPLAIAALGCSRPWLYWTLAIAAVGYCGPEA